MSRVDNIFARVKVGMEARYLDFETDILVDGNEIGDSTGERDLYLIDRAEGKTYLISVREIRREPGNE